MTLDELKAEAKKQGYGLHQLQPYVPIRRCRCGRKPHRLMSIGGHDMYKCDCGLKTGWQRSDKEARKVWNKMMEEP